MQGADKMNKRIAAAETERPELTISPEVVCYLALKAREFDVKDESSEADPASNAIDDDMRSVLEEHDDDPVEEELSAMIGSLSRDGQIDLVALAWLGRGDGDIADWQQLREQAAAARTGPTSRYLMGLPLLGDYLEEGLAAFGISCTEYEQVHLSSLSADP
jgi:hypothetical protein